MYPLRVSFGRGRGEWEVGVGGGKEVGEEVGEEVWGEKGLC